MVCKYWIELDDDHMSCYEYCKMFRIRCSCSGCLEQCNRRNMEKEE